MVEVVLIELNPKIPFITKFEKDFGPLIKVKGHKLFHPVLKGLVRGKIRIYLVIAIKI
jgi:hypothetical protein